jgi:hypothetical protein
MGFRSHEESTSLVQGASSSADQSWINAFPSLAGDSDLEVSDDFPSIFLSGLPATWQAFRSQVDIPSLGRS